MMTGSGDECAMVRVTRIMVIGEMVEGSLLVLDDAQLGCGCRVLLGGCGRSCSGGHTEKRVAMMGQGGVWRMVVLVVGLLDSVVHCNRSAWTIAVLAAAPVGDVLVVVASDLVVSITVEYERSSAPLSGYKRYIRHCDMSMILILVFV